MAVNEKNILFPDPSSIDISPVNETWMRQAVYRLFASLHLYPNRERLETLQTVVLELQSNNPLWTDHFLANQFKNLFEFVSGLNEGSINTVEEEYVALFSVNPYAPPYESYYQDPEGFVRSWIVIQLENEYARAGLNVARSFKEPPDHVAIELEFMAFLCSIEAESHETNNQSGVKSSLERQNKFLNLHLGNWYPMLAQAVKEAPTHGLYTLTVEVTNTFLQYETKSVVEEGVEQVIEKS
jgi:TorA maturation chaperone TorD